MAYPQGCCGPTYGGAREWARAPAGYRALSGWGLGFLSADAVTIRGKARFFTGEVTESWRRNLEQSCETCHKYADKDPEHMKCVASGWYQTTAGDRLEKCIQYVKVVKNDKRPGIMNQEATRDRGWALWIPQLVPTGGGYLGGWARLEGSIPSSIQDGVEISLTGQWIGTKPNNLCVGCGWPFQVAGVSTSEAATPGAGALTLEDQEAYREARIEASGIQAEQAAREQGASEQEAQEYRKRVEEDIRAGGTGQGLEVPTGEAGEPAGAPGLTMAGLSTGTIAALALGGLLILPLLTKKGRSSRRPGGVQRWGI